MNQHATVQTRHRVPMRPAEGQTLRRAAIDESAVDQAPPIVHEVLRSAGQPLDAKTRARLEPLFGHDFSGVRVHADARAAESAQAVNALAYTVGRDVVFGAGQYAPASGQGQRVLAHELTHVVQQQAYPAAAPQALTVGPVDDPLEREADREADRAADGLARPGGHSAPSAVLQRQPLGLGLTGPGLGQSRPSGIVLPSESMDLEGSENLSAQNPKLVALAQSFRSTQASHPGATLKLSAELSEAAQSGTAKANEERARLNRRLADARDALQTLGVSRDKLAVQWPTAFSTSAHGQISVEIYPSQPRSPYILPPGPDLTPNKTTPGQPPPSSGLPDIGKLLTLTYGPLTVKLPGSMALKLPVKLTASKTLEVNLSVEAPGSLSLSIKLDGTPYVTVSVKASVSYDKEKGATGSAGIQIETTRTVCHATSAEELRASVTKAGDDLKKAMQEFNAEADELKRMGKGADIVSALKDMYDAVDKAKSKCETVPAATFEFGFKGPLGGGTETDPSQRTPGYVGGTLTIPF